MSRIFVPLVVFVGLALGCSSDDAGTDATDETPAPTEVPAVTDPPPTTAPTDAGDDADPDPPATDSIPAVTAPPETQPTLPEVGVPGLDSELVVCRAWSRFAGSFQIAAVAASFGDDPMEAARLEVMASPVVVAAVEEMIDNWPEELADEVDLVADGYVGPYGRRSALALAALEEAAGDPAVVEAVADLWIDALERRDPSEVLPELIVPDDLAVVIDAAALAFDAEVVPIPQDPSLVSEVAVPQSEQFLFETCPDRGTLAGSEVDG